ncbi:MAG TPA: hypothetical protein PLL76_23900, partial [Thermoanaerobaculia bacterium]|nr:hypothetical protein [Thermoanaerobaculia bacterium]
RRRRPTLSAKRSAPRSLASGRRRLSPICENLADGRSQLAAANPTPAGYHGDPDGWCPRSGGYQAPREAPKWTKRRR